MDGKKCVIAVSGFWCSLVSVLRVGNSYGDRQNYNRLEGCHRFDFNRPRVPELSSNRLGKCSRAAHRFGRGIDRFERYGSIDEGQSSTAESFILAENEREVPPYLRVCDRNNAERIGPDIFGNVRTRNEANPDVRCHKTFQEFARVEFHRNLRFQAALVEEIFQRVASMATFWYQQRKGRDLRYRSRFQVRQRVLGRRDDYQLVAMDWNDRESRVSYRQ